MKCGEVYGFFTRKARRPKHKFQVFICVDPYTRKNPGSATRWIFLFINTEDEGNCLPIDSGDWKEMTNDSGSYICGTDVFRYTDSDLRKYKVTPKGFIEKDALVRLLNHVGASKVLYAHDIDIITDALINRISEMGKRE